MAEDYAPLYRSIWNDDDFRALTGAAQRLYLALMSSPNRSPAGVVGLTPKKWVRGAADLTPAVVEQALTELDGTGFLVVDDDTEEVLVRSYLRRAKVYAHIRTFARALRDIDAVESARLRSALGQELVRLPRLRIPEREPHKTEAEVAQRRLDELASMLCDAPPERPFHPMGHAMSHGMADGMGHGIGIGTGTGVGTGAGTALGSSSSRDLVSESDAGARGSYLRAVNT